MRHLFDYWKQVAGRLHSAGTIALFLDFDGTLARIRPKPDEVDVDRNVRQVLAILARSPRLRVWVISGRRYADIRDRINVPGVQYFGLHGWEGRDGAHLTEESRSTLEYVRRMLGGVLVNHRSIWVEDKESALTVHYREAPDCVRRQALESIRAAVGPFADSLRISAGKHMWEIIPRELEDKGAVVRRQWAAVASRSTPVYAGDDVVDEPAFAALSSGVTIHVGRLRPTRAQYFLRDVNEVGMFLEKLRAAFCVAASGARPGSQN
jgi:trehalose 6-phosphate phosphatase